MTIRFFTAMLWAWTGVYGAALAANAGPDLAPGGEHFAITAQAGALFGEQGPTSMTVDIKPGSPENVIRAGSKLVIPVAILGSSDLEVIDINPRTIRLNGVDIMLLGKSDKNLCRQTDINGDSLEDLVCDVRTTGYKIEAGTYMVILKAATYGGESLLGKDRIKIVRK